MRMNFFTKRSLLQLLLATATIRHGVVNADADIVEIGGDVGWTEGVCYQNVRQVKVGDTLRFTFGGHDVYRLPTQNHFENCDFSDALLMAGIGRSPFEYQVTASDAEEGTLYFACSVGDHCAGGTQKVTINVMPDLGQSLTELPAPESKVAFGLSAEACADLHMNNDEGSADNMQLDSDCTEPVLQDDGRYYVSCLSPRATLTPGGVINNLFVLHYPYPKDKRVKVGLRTWEFVQDIPDSENGDVAEVPINQLYVHHLSGRVILGQGTEGIRRSEPDAPYPEPYGVVNGDEGENMVFHIIDLRGVDDWLPCIECRCASGDGSYLDTASARQADTTSNSIPGPSSITGGVNCCTNCTSLTGPTVDYRMRYNVSYSYIEDDDTVKVLQMITADVSPVVGKNIEFDVPAYTQLPPELQKPGRPTIQRLERELPFNEMFKMEFFGDDYSGPDTVRLFRCVGHLHVAAVGMWLEDAETGQSLCSGEGTYGTNPDRNKGFLTAVRVDNYEEPIVFPADRMVRLITEYDASEVHTGVMGMYFLFVDSGDEIPAKDADLKVEICYKETCDVALLPSMTLEDVAAADACEDTLAQNPACQFAGLCDCEDFINAPESTGCGGVYSSPQGDIQVNSVCAKSCGCPSTSGCTNELTNSPMCTFGQLCDCETLVSAPESSGCGGVYTSDMGNVNIDDVCSNYCDACETKGAEELFAEAYVEQLEQGLQSTCRYSTDECRNMLYNLFSCGMENPGVEALDDASRRALITHASRLTLKYSKLGDSSIHDDDDEDDLNDLEICEDSPVGDSSSTSNMESKASNWSLLMASLLMFSTFMLSVS